MVMVVTLLIITDADSYGVCVVCIILPLLRCRSCLGPHQVSDRRNGRLMTRISVSPHEMASEEAVRAPPRDESAAALAAMLSGEDAQNPPRDESDAALSDTSSPEAARKPSTRCVTAVAAAATAAEQAALAGAVAAAAAGASAAAAATAAVAAASAADAARAAATAVAVAHTILLRWTSVVEKVMEKREKDRRRSWACYPRAATRLLLEATQRRAERLSARACLHSI